MDKSAPEVLLLLSGGVDSTTCLASYICQEIPVSALFIDYGQASLEQELRASREVANYYNVPYARLTLSGSTKKNSGLINGRNLFLLAAALIEAPPEITNIVIGVHSGTVYKDCGAQFVNRINNIFSLYVENRIEVSAPFLEWTKDDIWHYGQELSIPISITWSCEGACTTPCGICLSCKDLKILNDHEK